ncbi:hypothetical protein PITC_010870 [Penicillium italicum]|uniref:Uncharacterized protein n=1 Tax=Penicillium italicum TaxID=40296 RepID=A0A0A2L5J5_PENIT|nr:hypothetical protein PITC_010870 [Penicillium italicum]
MPDRKQPIRSGKAPAAGTPNNGFTTERSVDGERRSIRHYHDGRVSQRESPVPGPVRKLTQSRLTSRTNSPSISTVLKTHDGRLSQRDSPVPGPVSKLTQSKLASRTDSTSTSTSTVPNAKAAPKPKEPEYQSPTTDEIEKLAGAVTNLFHPERTKPFDKPPPEPESPQSWSSDSSYGMITPPFPVASPTPEDSPELMSTEVFPLPVAASSSTSDEDANLISAQWEQIGGKNRGDSDIHN